ncbi:MAG: FxsB family radical SAM/SPASM domain protein [Acidobacteriota bacterium]|nr:FxsB family radical SAM/SPASM domain protein [Acidobacteriota bacterium]
MVAAPPRITSFLVKIASRCNLACDYCYMYEHADQGWRGQPALMSERVRRKLAERVGEYARREGLERLVVVFHGGEPLLAGPGRIAETARWIKQAVPSLTRVDFSLQTNGTLLDEEALDRLASEGVSVSLSIDGPRRANDLHRLDHRGRTSFPQTLRALELLESRPDVYGGVIAVVDPSVTPDELFEFFGPRLPPRLDFLLPDANHERLPPGREAEPGLYRDWLLRAFDVWFDQYPHVPVRLFDAILSGVAGLPSDTDAFGFGDVSLLTVETDGTYHDLDVLKITTHGATALGLDLETHSIAEAAGSPRIAAHRGLLRAEGLSERCRSCPEVGVCGGGSVPHRYSREGFNNPTVYCGEMLALIGHARERVRAALREEGARSAETAVGTQQAAPIDLASWERPESSGPALQNLLDNWASGASRDFENVLGHVERRHEALRPAVAEIRKAPEELVKRLAAEPGPRLWATVMLESFRGVTVRSIDGDPIRPEPGYVAALLEELRAGAEPYPRVHREDKWLRLPFGDRIIFEAGDVTVRGAGLVAEAFEIIGSWRPALMEEIRRLDTDIQFIRDPSAHPDKAVSFSDNSTFGALYVAVAVSGGLIDPYLLADSIIHEHRHQKLYLLQREVRLFHADEPLVRSPWREDPRPPSGLLHAVFVFVHLHEYWEHLAADGPDAEVRGRARGELEMIRGRVEEALPTLRGTPLTERGAELVDVLEGVFRGSARAVK